MPKPAIITVDDDPEVSQAIARDLRARYGEHYRILRATSGRVALEMISEQTLKGRPIALMVADQRMPEMTGTEMLRAAQDYVDNAKTVLLTAYADTDAAITAINDIGLDYYLVKPWDPPEDRLYPVIDDLLDDWRRSNPDADPDVRVVGHQWSEKSHDVKTFLARNHVPYTWIDVERDPHAQPLIELANASADDLPLVLVPDGDPLVAPTNVQLASALGLHTQATQELYDLCVVGAGPAGLAAAVYAASEGLKVVVVEREAPGGQAGTSAAIENYLGFPRGLTGADLTQRAVAQASRFGAEMVLAREVTGFEQRGPVRALLLDGDASIEARAMLVATGVSYRKLAAPGLDEFTGRGVFYGATASEAQQVAGEDVYVVGAANSAGQAALNLARYARTVTMVVRGSSLEASMSSYLIDRIEATPNMEVRFTSEVVGCRGEGHLEGITIADRSEGTTTDVDTNWLFVFIGAAPRTDWLGGDVVRDDNGYVVTGVDVLATAAGAADWPVAARAPMPLETSIPGVFAAGDVRQASMKRVASAVGEGAMAVHLVHQYLAST